jgi:putative addiction module component (TIGR02574 family)
MTERASQILAEALALTSVDRAVVVEQLLSSLDRPDAAVDALWAREVEVRLDAYDAGQMAAVSAEEVFTELDEA